jgi:hypothetical protein
MTLRPGTAAASVIFALLVVSSQPASTQSPGLKIVVVEGEDAVNIIQHKTAVAPVIEVRDRNDQPVAGAIVRFAIQGGRATFGGAPTLTVTTNAVGQAVATGLTPTASGAVQIGATAAFQGQTAAAVTLAQTNVMTAAQAAAISGATGSSGGAASGTGAGAGGGSGGGATAGSGAGAGGGGGLSATTIGIIGGAVAGGAVVATQAGGEAATGQATLQRFSGAMDLDMQTGCLLQRFSASLSIAFEAASDLPDTIVSNGRLNVQNGTSTVVSRPPNCGVLSGTTWGMGPGAVTGTLNNLESHFQDSVTSLVGTPVDRSFDFRGGMVNGVISGTVTITFRGQPPDSSGSAGVTLNRVAQ